MNAEAPIHDLPFLRGLSADEKRQKLVATIKDCEQTICDPTVHPVVQQASKALRVRSMHLLAELSKDGL